MGRLLEPNENPGVPGEPGDLEGCLLPQRGTGVEGRHSPPSALALWEHLNPELENLTVT